MVSPQASFSRRYLIASGQRAPAPRWRPSSHGCRRTWRARSRANARAASECSRLRRLARAMAGIHLPLSLGERQGQAARSEMRRRAGKVQCLLFRQDSLRVVEQVLALAVVVERDIKGMLSVHGHPSFLSAPAPAGPRCASNPPQATADHPPRRPCGHTQSRRRLVWRSCPGVPPRACWRSGT